MATINDDFLIPQIEDGQQIDPSVAALANGGWVVVWQGVGANIQARLFDENGQPAGDEFQVETTSTINTSPKVVALANGGFAVVWESTVPNNSDIRGRFFDADGDPVDVDFVVNSTTGGYQFDPWAMASGNDVLVFWRSNDSAADGYDIRGALVSTTIVEPDSLLATAPGDQINPSFAFSASGLLAVWENEADGDVAGFFRNFSDPDIDLPVNTTAGDEVSEPEVVSLVGGGFVVVWTLVTGTESDTDEDEVRAQLYDADGNTVGGEILVNTTTVEDQRNPTVAALPDGGFVIMWTDQSETGADSDDAIRGQTFDADGNKVGEEFLVNTTTAEDQLRPVVATNEDGDIFVTYRSIDSDDDENWDILGRLIKAPEITSNGGGETAALSFAENGTGPIANVALADPDLDVTYEITGGADAARFAIDPETGELTFIAAPDYENPTDTGSDNVYEVEVSATNDAFVSDSQTIEVTVTDIASLKLIGTKKKDTLTGAGDDDILKGKNGKDTLNGEGGDDLLNGGKKKDTLTGGEDADSFLFASKLKNKWADIITDFEVGTDSIHLDRDIFKKVGKAGPLKDKFFDTGKKADSKKDRILYDEKTGWLRHDEDGKGGDKATKVAKVFDDGNPVGGLSADDFMLI